MDFHIIDSIINIAQASPVQTPSSNSSVPDAINEQLNFLKEQIKYLSEANKQLSEGNKQLNENFKYYVNVLLAISGISSIAFIGTVWRKLAEARETIAASVQEEVSRRISNTVGKRIDLIERSLQTEIIVEDTKILYYVPGLQERQPNPASHVIDLLKGRQFQSVELVSFDQIKQSRRSRKSRIIVLDFVNGKSDEDSIKDSLESIVTNNSRESDIFIAYIAGHSSAISGIQNSGKGQNLLPARSLISLVSNVTDAAYFAYAQESIR